MSKIIAFYGQDNILSNLYQYEDNGKLTSVENQFQAWKASAFAPDTDWFYKIIDANPKDAKRLGKKVPNFNKEEWENDKEYYMSICLQHKINCCPGFVDALLDTGDAYLAESAPRDTYWGTGYGKERTEAGESRGKNRMGILLMDIRENLQRVNNTIAEAIEIFGVDGGLDVWNRIQEQKRKSFNIDQELRKLKFRL